LYIGFVVSQDKNNNGATAANVNFDIVQDFTVKV
jgi:hypothetical protein